MKRPIHDLFEEFRAACMHDATDAQVASARATFFAAAGSVMDFLFEHLDEAGHARLRDAIHTVEEEIAEWAEQLDSTPSGVH